MTTDMQMKGLAQKLRPNDGGGPGHMQISARQCSYSSFHSPADTGLLPDDTFNSLKCFNVPLIVPLARELTST